jgi:thiaminase
LKASRAYASLGTYVIYERRPPKWRVYMSWIYTYEGKVFIEWPDMSSRNV